MKTARLIKILWWGCQIGTWYPTHSRGIGLRNSKIVISWNNLKKTSMPIFYFDVFLGIVCGCFYGPYLYLVVSIGGLYLLGKFPKFQNCCIKN